jgi:hypothetical protein
MLTLNGLPVIAFVQDLPLTGRWVATIEASGDEDDLTLAAGDTAILQWDSDVDREIARGHVRTCAERNGTYRATLAGGNGGLSQVIGPGHFRQSTVRTVLASLLTEAGEVLDGSASRATLDTPLAFWSRVEGPGLEELARLCTAVGANWRFLSNGRLWVGVEDWPAFPDFDAEDLDSDGADGSRLYGVEDPRLVAGVTWRDQQIARVEHSFTRDESLRTTVWV